MTTDTGARFSMAKSRSRVKPRRPREARINLRLSKDLYEILEEKARADARSLSGFVERLLIDAARKLGAPLDASGRRV
jgi:predicted HicB family RNase H-like nuclease